MLSASARCSRNAATACHHRAGRGSLKEICVYSSFGSICLNVASRDFKVTSCRRESAGFRLRSNDIGNVFSKRHRILRNEFARAPGRARAADVQQPKHRIAFLNAASATLTSPTMPKTARGGALSWDIRNGHIHTRELRGLLVERELRKPVSVPTFPAPIEIAAAVNDQKHAKVAYGTAWSERALLGPLAPHRFYSKSQNGLTGPPQKPTDFFRCHLPPLLTNQKPSPLQ